MKYVKVNITHEMEEAHDNYCGEDSDCDGCPCRIGEYDCIYNYDIETDEI